MCEWFDETCGSLLDHLDDRKLSENTLVIYVTDNGWIQRTSTTKVPDGWRPSFAPKSKQSPYDGGVRTPIMVRWKGKLRGRLHSSLVSSIDLMPTILDACGVKPPPKLPGVSLLPACRGKKGSVHNALFGESFAHDIADLDRPAASLLYRWAIEGDWKLIQKFPGKIGRYPPIHAGISSESELYDLSADPLEEEDRVSEHTEIRNRLQKLTTQEFSHTPAEPERTGGPP